jgi:uncharacterized protein (DUF433 family)
MNLNWRPESRLVLVRVEPTVYSNAMLNQEIFADYRELTEAEIRPLQPYAANRERGVQAALRNGR